MPRIRINAAPNVLEVDRGENPVMGGLTQGLHSLWEGQNRAAEINRQGERDRHNDEMQLWERQRGAEETRFSHEHTAREEARQAKLDEQALNERGLAHEHQRAREAASDADRATGRSLEERRVGAEEQRAKAYAGRGGAGAMNEREAWRQAEIMAQHEAVDEFGKPMPVKPDRVQALHDHLMETTADPREHDPMGLYPHGDLWQQPAAAPAVAPAAPQAPAAAPSASAGSDPGLWDRMVNGAKPAISPQELGTAVGEDKGIKAARVPVDPAQQRRAAFLQLAGDSAPADEGILANVLSDDPSVVQAALQHQYRGRPEHLKVAVQALRQIHGAKAQPAQPMIAAPQAAPQAPPQVAAPPAQDRLWEDPVASGM